MINTCFADSYIFCVFLCGLGTTKWKGSFDLDDGKKKSLFQLDAVLDLAKGTFRGSGTNELGGVTVNGHIESSSGKATFVAKEEQCADCAPSVCAGIYRDGSISGTCTTNLGGTFQIELGGED
jgi:hypothetical protein